LNRAAGQPRGPAPFVRPRERYERDRHPPGVRHKARSEDKPASAPPEVGQTPPDFTLRDLDGKTVHLAELFPLAPLVLIFFRGAGSTACVEQLREYKKRNVGLYESGATLIAICSDDAATARTMVERENLPFRVLLDEGEKVLTAWGLRDSTGERRCATFVIDKSGSVVWRAIDRDAERTPAARVLEWMRGSAGSVGQAQS
jgi:peroxiredoxin